MYLNKDLYSILCYVTLSLIGYVDLRTACPQMSDSEFLAGIATLKYLKLVNHFCQNDHDAIQKDSSFALTLEGECALAEYKENKRTLRVAKLTLWVSIATLIVALATFIYPLFKDFILGL